MLLARAEAFLEANEIACQLVHQLKTRYNLLGLDCHLCQLDLIRGFSRLVGRSDRFVAHRGLKLRPRRMGQTGVSARVVALMGVSFVLVLILVSAEVTVMMMVVMVVMVRVQV